MKDLGGSTSKRLVRGLSTGAPERETPSYEAKTRQGEGPREGETQESQDAVSRRDPAAVIPTGEGMKPLKRGVPTERSDRALGRKRPAYRKSIARGAVAPRGDGDLRQVRL